MKIILNIAVSDPMDTGKSSLVYELAKEMNVFFSDKQYGDSVETISINFLMTFSREGYEDWYKEKKPVYTEYKSTVSKLTGQTIEITKTFRYEIKLADETIIKFAGSTHEESRRVIATEVFQSLHKLDKLPVKVDFDKQRFKEDVAVFFEEKKLL